MQSKIHSWLQVETWKLLEKLFLLFVLVHMALTVQRYNPIKHMPKMGQCVIFFLFQLKAEQLLFGRMDNFPKVNSRQKLLNRLKKVD